MSGFKRSAAVQGGGNGRRSFSRGRFFVDLFNVIHERSAGYAGYVTLLCESTKHHQKRPRVHVVVATHATCLWCIASKERPYASESDL